MERSQRSTTDIQCCSNDDVTTSKLHRFANVDAMLDSEFTSQYITLICCNANVDTVTSNTQRILKKILKQWTKVVPD